MVIRYIEIFAKVFDPTFSNEPREVEAGACHAYSNNLKSI
jgi:hypothetical protein